MSKWHLINPHSGFGEDVQFKSKKQAKKALRALRWALDCDIVVKKIDEPKLQKQIDPAKTVMRKQIITIGRQQTMRIVYEDLHVVDRQRESAYLGGPYGDWKELGVLTDAN